MLTIRPAAVSVISSSTKGNLTNYFSVTVPSGVSDPDLGSHSAIDVDTLTPDAEQIRLSRSHAYFCRRFFGPSHLSPEMSLLVRPLARVYLALRYQVLGRRHRRLVLEEVDGVPLLVLPEVFNGVLFRTGTFLARTVESAVPVPEAETAVALDMGAGSGIGAIFAARRGFRAVGVDINPEAVRCARINVLLNRLEDRVEIRQGDLFAPVSGERFDLVLFNPPFFRGAPRSALDRAWRATDVMERFAAGLPAHLRPGGRALIVLSTDGDWRGMLQALAANGLEPEPVARRDLGNEILTAYSVGRPR